MRSRNRHRLLRLLHETPPRGHRAAAAAVQETQQCSISSSTIIEQLASNRPEFQELLLSSFHTLLDFESLVEALSLNTSVTRIRIHGFFVEKLSSQRQDRLWETVGNLPSLEELYLNYFVDFSLHSTALSQVLHRALYLRKLSIHDSNFVWKDDDNEDSRISLKDHKSLTTVNISQLQTPVDTGYSSLNLLIDMLATAPNVNKIMLRVAQDQHYPISSQSLELLSLKSLKILDLRNIVLSNDSMIEFMQHLMHSKEQQPKPLGRTLKDIALQCDEVLNEEACVAMGQMLQQNTTLERLELWGARIDDGGLVFIANSLKINRSLKVLQLSHDNITKAGQQAIVGMLERNCFLESIILRCFDSHTFLATIDFYLTMNATQIRRLMINENASKEQIFDKLVVHTNRLDYLFHLLRGNPSFVE